MNMFFPDTPARRVIRIIRIIRSYGLALRHPAAPACVASLPRHLPGVDASVRACCIVFAYGTACFLQHVEQLVFCMVLA